MCAGAGGLRAGWVGGWGRGRGDAVCGHGSVSGQALEIDRGAAEEELDVEERRPATASTFKAVLELELCDHALGVGHAPLVRHDPCLRLAALSGGERFALGVCARHALDGREHRPLRRDVGEEAALARVLVDALGGVALVGADRDELWADETSPVEDQREPVPFVAVGLLAQAGNDTARPRIDRHLPAVHEMRTLPRLAAQLRVRIGARDSSPIRASPARRRARARLGQRQLRRLTQPRGLFTARTILHTCRRRSQGQARAQALERRVRLGVETVDREMGGVEEIVLGAKSDRALEGLSNTRPSTKRRECASDTVW